MRAWRRSSRNTVTSTTPNLQSFSREEKLQLLEALEELDRRKSRNKLSLLFPDKGPLRRELYQKHLQFFAAGKDYNERAFIAANRVGKTIGAGYEMTCHLTGLYPEWWEGWRFNSPIRAWACGDTAKTARDILQAALLGPPGDEEGQGTGLVPGDKILRKSPKHGLADAVETAFIRHVSGGTSQVQFKSYDQGRVAFQGTEQEVIWLDEECDQETYIECLTRTMTTKGRVILTFTPLFGLTPLVLSFLPELAPAAL